MPFQIRSPAGDYAREFGQTLATGFQILGQAGEQRTQAQEARYQRAYDLEQEKIRIYREIKIRNAEKLYHSGLNYKHQTAILTAIERARVNTPPIDINGDRIEEATRWHKAVMDAGYLAGREFQDSVADPYVMELLANDSSEILYRISPGILNDGYQQWGDGRLTLMKESQKDLLQDIHIGKIGIIPAFELLKRNETNLLERISTHDLPHDDIQSVFDMTYREIASLSKDINNPEELLFAREAFNLYYTDAEKKYIDNKIITLRVHQALNSVNDPRIQEFVLNETLKDNPEGIRIGKQILDKDKQAYLENPMGHLLKKDPAILQGYITYSQNPTDDNWMNFRRIVRENNFYDDVIGVNPIFDKQYIQSLQDTLNQAFQSPQQSEAIARVVGLVTSNRGDAAHQIEAVNELARLIPNVTTADGKKYAIPWMNALVFQNNPELLERSMNYMLRDDILNASHGGFVNTKGNALPLDVIWSSVTFDAEEWQRFLTSHQGLQRDIETMNNLQNAFQGVLLSYIADTQPGENATENIIEQFQETIKTFNGGFAYEANPDGTTLRLPSSYQTVRDQSYFDTYDPTIRIYEPSDKGRYIYLKNYVALRLDNEDIFLPGQGEIRPNLYADNLVFQTLNDNKSFQVLYYNGDKKTQLFINRPSVTRELPNGQTMTIAGGPEPLIIDFSEINEKYNILNEVSEQAKNNLLRSLNQQTKVIEASDLERADRLGRTDLPPLEGWLAEQFSFRPPADEVKLQEDIQKTRQKFSNAWERIMRFTNTSQSLYMLQGTNKALIGLNKLIDVEGAQEAEQRTRLGESNLQIKKEIKKSNKEIIGHISQFEKRINDISPPEINMERLNNVISQNFNQTEELSGDEGDTLIITIAHMHEALKLYNKSINNALQNYSDKLVNIYNQNINQEMLAIERIETITPAQLQKQIIQEIIQTTTKSSSYFNIKINKLLQNNFFKNNYPEEYQDILTFKEWYNGLQ